MQITINEMVDNAIRGGETLTSIGRRLNLSYSELKDMHAKAKLDRSQRAALAFASIPGVK